MSSYYKKIDGKNYDRAMLDIADKSVDGKGDGRISLADARGIIKAVKDGGKITDIEKRTLNYILEKYKLTETALKHIEKSLSENMTDNKNAVIETDQADVQKKQSSEKTKRSEGNNQALSLKSNKGLIIFLSILLLVILTIFIFNKYFYKKAGSENSVTENKSEIAPTGKTETGTAVIDRTAEKIKEKTLSGNEYLVKDKDSLIKISEALYGDYKKWEDIYKLNNKTISRPTILYPGQILTLPAKSKK